MAVFETREFDDHEHVSFFSDPSVGLRAIVAIHRAGPLGTAGGGCRMWPYRDEHEAVRDALRLSRAMTHKLALVELPAGGAKAVVIGDPARDKSEGLLRALGRAVERLGGRFVVAEDVGTTPADLAVIGEETIWVDRHAGGGDPAWATAHGVLVCMRAAVRKRLGLNGLAGVTVAVQGLGRVGRSLCRQLAAAGARLSVADLDPRAVAEMVDELAAVAVPPEQVAEAPVDVFAPCALGDALDERTVPRLRCAVVAGSANNQLADPALADLLVRRGILHVPDVVCNAGGVLGAALGAGGDDALRPRLEQLGALLDGVLARAEREGISPQAAAERTARERFGAMGGRP